MLQLLEQTCNQLAAWRTQNEAKEQLEVLGQKAFFRHKKQLMSSQQSLMGMKSYGDVQMSQILLNSKNQAHAPPIQFNSLNHAGSQQSQPTLDVRNSYSPQRLRGEVNSGKTRPHSNNINRNERPEAVATESTAGPAGFQTQRHKSPRRSGGETADNLLPRSVSAQQLNTQRVSKQDEDKPLEKQGETA
uniref:Uncharacterized protein n=1 Tax=Strombidium rassoulzadegani TaxID=1082188 RepID=A0A7S3CSA0_9SPIT|mmetsp:Transcript_5727/g.9825  ORF Transcript_5727/g.9825 Transcript_5727/m.9825 type:complete len:189 (+) Transcript_5727:391-957(+)